MTIKMVETYRLPPAASNNCASKRAARLLPGEARAATLEVK
jgi:hypothetical protein